NAGHPRRLRPEPKTSRATASAFVLTLALALARAGTGPARVVLLQLAVQRLAVEPQPLGGARLVASLGREHLHNVVTLQLRERQPARQRRRERIGLPFCRWRLGRTSIARRR